jgi:DNA-binding beta-propeller fold protein YncE
MHPLRPVLLALVVVVGTAGAAHAAPPQLGALTQLPGTAGCITDSSAPPCLTGDEIYSPEGIAMSPYGNDVYVAENYYGGVTHLRRDASGGLTYVSCINATGSNGCGGFAPLTEAHDVAVSPDGHQVYVITRATAGAIITLDRNATTGELTPSTVKPCIADTGVNGCEDDHGMADLNAIAIAPNGSTIYVGSGTSQGGVAVLARDAATGVLTYRTCTNGDGHDSCQTSAALNDVEGLEVSPDSAFVYSAARSGKLATMRYDGTHLNVLQCFNTGGTVVSGCVQHNAIFAPVQVAIAEGPTGSSSLYAADYNGNVVTEWIRDRGAGTLIYKGCRSYNGAVNSHTGICVTDNVEQGAVDVAAAPGGDTVYMLGDRSNPDQGSQAIAAYRRDPTTGALTKIVGSCWADVSDVPSGCTAAHGMYDPRALVVSSNGAWAQVAGSSAVATFSAEVAPTCAPVSAMTTAPAPVTIALPCADANGDPLTLSVGTPPAHGTLGAIGGDGSVGYTPAAAFAGDDSFTYSASDGTLSSTPATAAVHVAQAPAGNAADTKAPTVTIRSLRCARHNHRRRCHAKGRAADDRAVTRVEVAVNRIKPKRHAGGAATRYRRAALANGVWSVSVGSLKRGRYRVRARAYDAAGHVRAVSRVIRVKR